MSQESMKFLVVDDFSTMRRIVRNLLKELGCTIAQGYFIAKPLPALAFTEWVPDWTAPGLE